MAQPLRILVAGGWYQAANRGNRGEAMRWLQKSTLSSGGRDDHL